MTIAEIRQILESPYDRKVWKSFLQTQFTNNKLNVEDRIISISDKTLSEQCISLGNYEINEYTKIGIFEVELSEKVNITRNRVALRNLMKDLTQQIAGAMVVFVQGDKWRFSYISKRKVKNKETNKIEDKQTAPKRYTYLFGKNEKALTAAIRFDKLIQKQKDNLFDLLSLDDFEEAFSVEKLSKEFFKNYKDTYEDFVQFLTGKRYAKKGKKYIEQVIHEPNWQLTALFNKDEKQARDFCKRMMGRIVFLYFIQKKGWLAVTQGKKWGEGNPDYLYDLFRKSKYKDDFYHLELVPLFFRTLNNPDYEKPNNDFRFPYLNGGLFDDSQDRKYNKLYLPESIFQNLFETFNNYNFTIYEDAPDEHTVAVDPEMLGHIFENLLEDNKDKGAFYTPKEIVHYMCKESLKAYLFAQDQKQFADDLAKDTLDKIIQQQELGEDEKAFAEKNAYKIIDALENVKICDPAIGSGAFPMGLLQEIFNAQIYLQELKGFKKAKTDADIKKHIIEESIYGVDIDAGAVDIARLRFWLSLVVDEPEPQPLPNLDFKIICANTLIPLGEISGYDMDAKASLAVKELEKIRHDFFNVSSESKLNLERQFKKVQTDLLSLRELATTDNYAFYTKLYEFNPFDFEAAPCSWFDPWWMFGVKDGFDIVIGNPPYVQLQKNGGKLAELYQTNKYKTFERTGDIYSLFYERGWELLKPKGALCFITSNKWMRAGYGESTRKFFAENTNPVLLIDFAGQKIFEAATVDVNILMFTRDKNQQKTMACIVKEDVLNELSVFVRQAGNISTFTNADSWVILSEIEQRIKEKIERVGTPLKDWDIQINYGIKTGFNDAFIIDSVKRKELIEQDPKSEKIIRPILRGRDIKRYGYEYADLYLITTFPSLRIDIEQYPAVKRHLLSFGMERLEQTGKEHIVNGEKIKARKKTNNKWFETQDSISYWDDFSKQKIVWGNLNLKASYAIAPEGVFVNAPCPMIVPASRYLLAILNSRLADYYIRKLGVTRNGGYFEYKPMFIEQFPVPIVSESEQRKIENMVKNISKLIPEKLIDEAIYELYNLTSEEADFLHSL